MVEHIDSTPGESNPRPPPPHTAEPTDSIAEGAIHSLPALDSLSTGPKVLRQTAAAATVVAHPAVRNREVCGLLLLVGLADVAIFRATGFAGAALFMLLAPFLLVLVARALRFLASHSAW